LGEVAPKFEGNHPINSVYGTVFDVVESPNPVAFQAELGTSRDDPAASIPAVSAGIPVEVGGNVRTSSGAAITVLWRSRAASQHRKAKSKRLSLRFRSAAGRCGVGVEKLDLGRDDTLEQTSAIVAGVEDRNLTVGRDASPDSPEVRAGPVFVGRRGDCNHAVVAGVHRRRHPADRVAPPRRVGTLEDGVVETVLG
jgi:hypothetical protein